MEQKEWKPTKRQETFLSLPDSIFEALYGGAAGGGKSEALVMLPLVRGFHQHPHFKGLILRRTFPELEKEIILRAHEYYPSAGGRYNDQKRRYRFPSGAIVEFGHAEHENDIRKYDTAEYNYIAPDELTSFTEFQYTYLINSRCRTADASLPAIARAGTNPGNVGHGWVRKYFVEPCVTGGKVLRSKVTFQGQTIERLRIFIPAKVQDNPYLMRADPTYLFRMGNLPPAERRAKQEGDWFTFEGQVFDDWRESPLPGEPANACHVYKPFEVFPGGKPPGYWPRILTIDWGYSAMLWVGLGAISPDGRLYVYDEYTNKREKISSWAPKVRDMVDNEVIDDIIMCASAWQNRGDEKNIAQQFEEWSKLTPRKPDNDRLGGKMLLQEYLRFLPHPIKEPVGELDYELAQEILRKRGMQAYDEYCASFRPQKPETNLPKLQVSEKCVELRKAIPLCVYDENNKEDVKEFDGDDPYDGIRYKVKAAEALKETSAKEFGKRQEVSKILEDFESTRNQNAFYMRMRILDASKKRSVNLRRFHV